MLLLTTLALGADALDDELSKARAVDASLSMTLTQADAMPPCTSTYSVRTATPTAAQASTALTEGSLTHGASHAIDADPTTAWVEGVEGVGRGEALRLKLDDMPKGLVVVPGYAKDERRWGSNHRVGTLLVRWLKPAEGVSRPEAWASGALQPTSTQSLRVTLQREGGLVPFAKPQLIDFGTFWNQNMEVTQVVALELVLIDADGKGATYEDTCISEVQLALAGDQLSFKCNEGWCASIKAKPEGCP